MARIDRKNRKRNPPSVTPNPAMEKLLKKITPAMQKPTKNASGRFGIARAFTGYQTRPVSWLLMIIILMTQPFLNSGHNLTL